MGKENRKLYLARFELSTYGHDLQHTDAVLSKASGKGTVVGWIDFMVGFPIACIELQSLVGEISSRPDALKQLVESVQDPAMVSPAFPKTLFGGYEEQKILMNLLYLDNDYSEFMANDLNGETKPTGLRWWLRTNLMADIDGTTQKWPYPTEFVALAVRLMPDRVSFNQESNPFLYSGCFLDTVYFTAGFIKEIIEPTDEKPWPSYKVTWRKNPDNDNSKGEYLMYSTDFTTYAVGDRVIILKDVTTEKKSQQWKDDDLKTMGGENTDPDTPVQSCAIAPIMFFSIDPEQEG